MDQDGTLWMNVRRKQFMLARESNYDKRAFESPAWNIGSCKHGGKVINNLSRTYKYIFSVLKKMFNTNY